MIEFGKQAVEKEIQSGLKWMRMRTAFTQLSEKNREAWDEEDYWKEVDLARKEAWEIYKREVGL